MTAAAEGAATSAVTACSEALLSSELQLRSSAEDKFSSAPRVAGCVGRVHVAPPFFVRCSAAPGPYLIFALVSPSPPFGDHEVCSVAC